MGNQEKSFTKGKTYIIVGTENVREFHYIIRDDFDCKHYMGDDNYIKKYFASQRQLKLERICKQKDFITNLVNTNIGK